MSTGNFKAMNYNMPMIVGRTRYQMIHDFIEDGETEIPAWYLEQSAQDDFDYAEELAAAFTENLKYHIVSVEPGYYENFQFVVKEKYENLFDLDPNAEYCLDDEDAAYYFDMEKEAVLEGADEEKEKIREWLENLGRRGFNHIALRGTFSNGEAMYDLVEI